ncbi:MAG: MBL fold metallo-hydrolase [Bacteroidetes bacterium]|nr:MBL fold metallo-hydrolase [Bacteroidota bacterium]
MKVEQIYTGCLAQGAYYIVSNGEAAIIDPLREVQPYIDRAEYDGVKIKYIFETHFHADFVSGHLTLAEKTGADIIYGPTAQTNFNAIIAKDNQSFKLGDVTLKVLHTPGHTMESMTILLLDEQGKEHAIFSGDTLFLGDVGRPDLAQKATSLTQDELAGLLFESLRNKIMILPDDVIVYPGHGAGSACGKNMMKETVDTLGHQKEINYALRADMTKAEFIKEVTDGLLPPPAYFPQNVKMNKEGYENIDLILSHGDKPLTAKEFKQLAEQHDALVLDVRDPEEFSKVHIPGSVFIGINGNFAPWVGTLIKDVKQPILLVSPKGKEKETVTRLARVGFDKTLGYLGGGLTAWQEEGYETDSIMSVSAETVAQQFKNDITIFDVRTLTEYQSEHVENAINIPLSDINDQMATFKAQEDNFYVHCKSGYRSMIAASILKARGIHNLYDINGGFQALAQTNVPKTEFVCPTTLT